MLMEIVLTVIAVLGGLLFIFSYIKFVLTGFRYHRITGFLAFLPVINLITLPTLMDGKLVRILIIGIIGLTLSVGAWFLGADKSLQKHISSLRGQPIIISSNKQEAANKNQELTAPKAQASSTEKNITDKTTTVAGATTKPIETTTQVAPQSVYFETLPKQALYSMEFIDAPVQQINTLQGRIVRISSNNGSSIEGQIQSIANGSVFIRKNGDGNIAYEMLIANIKQLQVMIKKN